MRVLFQTAIAGHIDDRYDFAHYPGQVKEIDDAQALAWIASGIAVSTALPGAFTGFDAVPDPIRAAAELAPRASRKRGK